MRTPAVYVSRQQYGDAFDGANAVGLELLSAPVRLFPQDKLVEIVRKSQQLALAGEGGEDVGEAQP